MLSLKCTIRLLVVNGNFQGQGFYEEERNIHCGSVKIITCDKYVV